MIHLAIAERQLNLDGLRAIKRQRERIIGAPEWERSCQKRFHVNERAIEQFDREPKFGVESERAPELDLFGNDEIDRQRRVAA
jgi:hypothetical protein